MMMVDDDEVASVDGCIVDGVGACGGGMVVEPTKTTDAIAKNWSLDGPLRSVETLMRLRRNQP